MTNQRGVPNTTHLCHVRDLQVTQHWNRCKGPPNQYLIWLGRHLRRITNILARIQPMFLQRSSSTGSQFNHITFFHLHNCWGSREVVYFWSEELVQAATTSIQILAEQLAYYPQWNCVYILQTGSNDCLAARSEHLSSVHCCNYRLHKWQCTSEFYQRNALVHNDTAEV